MECGKDSSLTRPSSVPFSCIDDHPDLPACAGCGRCCHLVVELREDDWVPAHFIVEHAGARCMDQHSNGACVALDPRTQLCTIYDDRPQTCRDFNRGEPLCRHILTQRAPSVA
ncbi:YkgJ family cysteine cluster protein [Oleiharenicola lentus]|uniref:YkgJ family cysteine cluster protein n=1 Tax=Oleiharenicola lentus TaxID=2508720 RepID=UPI003F66E4C2